MKDFSRADRLSSQIGRELAEIFIKTLPLPKDIMLSITEVEVSRDLRYAKVFYSIFGPDNAVTVAGKFLDKNYKAIRMELAKNIRIRFMPELKFIYDESIIREQRILNLLDRIKKDEPES